MAWWERIRTALRREAADVKEGLSKAGAAIDAELERKQRELDATPNERIEMLEEEIKAADDQFAELEAKVRNQVTPPTDTK